MLKNFNTWLNEQAAVPANPMETPAPDAAAAPVAGESDKIRAVLISKPIGSVDKPGDMTTKQFNEYVLDMERVRTWIQENAKDSEQDILDYLSGKDIDIKDAHKKFTAAVQANELENLKL